MNEETIVINGRRPDGTRLRPSDWIERISSMMAKFGPDHRLHYSTSIHPSVIDGQKCLVVDPEIQEKNPELYEYILHFTKCNNLTIHPDQSVTNSSSENKPIRQAS